MSAKPELPPLGGRQSLKKPMPRCTRYKGESHEAWNIRGRYEEHMAKQRTSAAAKAQQEAGGE